MFGRVRKLMSEQYYGFIVTEDGESFFFHGTQVINRPFAEIVLGERVEFDLVTMPDGRFRAVNVEVQ
jgi:cold shock CspA family protein